MGTRWDWMSQVCICTFIHLYDDVISVNCYVYIMTCTGIAFGLGIIHWACGCSTPPLYLFPPGVFVLAAIWWLLSCTQLCESIKCKCIYLEV